MLIDLLGKNAVHYQGIVHRDIKPANLLLTGDRVVKISDFGVSYFSELLAGDDRNVYDANDTASRSRIARELAKTAGSPAFFAPELCTVGDDSAPRITKAIDVWALGVTLYCLVFGRCPFEAETEYELFKLIPTQPLEFPDDIPIEDDLRDLLCRLLTKDFERRITLEQVRSHAWVTADLEDPELWKEEADPRHYKAVEVTDEEVSRAVTITEKIRRGIQKLSSSISHFTQAFDMKRRGKSLSSQGHSPSIKPTVSDRSTSDTAHPPAVDHSRDQYQTMSQYASNGGEQLVTSPNTRGETLSPDSLSQEMILLPHCEPSNDSGHNGSYGQSDNESYSRQNDDHKYDNEGYEDEYSDYDTGPWPLERKDSSASTLSGLIIGRGRQRSADADNM